MKECYFCEEEAETHDHHVIPDRLGPIENRLVALCPTCHGRLHAILDPLIDYLVEDYTKDDGERSTRARYTGRRDEVAEAFGEPLEVVLRTAVESSDTRRGAIEWLNNSLEDAEGYDHEERGKVSPNTFYKWCRDLEIF